jgi:hypothetical protein
LAGHLFTRWLYGPNHNGVGTETFNLPLRFISNPFGDCEQPDNARHTDKNAKDR